MENAVEIKGLRKVYQKFTLDGISLSLPRGCVMGFIGENGAGKSTAIKCMLGLVRPDAGEIRLLGRDPQRDRSVMDRVGMVLDSGFFPPEMSPKEIERILKHVYRHWDGGTFRQLLERFSIDPRKKIMDFSRGMVMKLSLAAALSHGAELLLLDEATSGLDPVVRDDILDLLLEFIQEESHSVFLSSHITGDLEKIADYIVFLHGGKIVASGEKDVLLDSYGLLKCGRDRLSAIDPGALVGYRAGEFGVTALVKKHRVPAGFLVEPATLDDIMLYSIKGETLGKGRA